MRLICERVTKRFAGTTAVKDINLDVEATCIVVMGANAAGKSTLLKMIATVLRPDEGRLILNGFDIVKHPHLIRKRLSYLPEEPALIETLSARENLKFFAKIKGDNGEFLNLSRMLEVDLDDHKPARNLSKGTRRKLSLCIALLGEPEILVLDEPTSGLDEEARAVVWSKLKELKEKNVAMIIATHQIEEVKDLADVLLILDKGHLIKTVQLGSVTSNIQL